MGKFTEQSWYRTVAAGAVALAAAWSAPVLAAAHSSTTIYPSDGTYTQTGIFTALGDSIAAGYCGWWCSMKPYTEYYANDIANTFDAAIDYRGRAHSGDTADWIYNEAYSHRGDIAVSDFVTVEACGNDYLDGRSTFRDGSAQSPENCSTTPIQNALNACKYYMPRIYDRVNSYAPSGTEFRALSMTIYYPGMNKDKSETCAGKSHFEYFLPFLVEGNWFTCDEAHKRGWKCADAFAEFHGADFDSNGDGAIDREQIRYVPGETLSSYKTRLTVTYKHLLTDANTKRTSSTTTADYLQGDDTHPTSAGHSRIGQAHANFRYNWVTKP